MSPSPKTPDEKKLPDEENSSTDELSHPQNHLHQEYVASTDESTSDDDNTNQQHENSNGYCLLPQDFDLNQQEQRQYDSENEDDEFLRFATLRVHASVNENDIPPVSSAPAHILESVWSSKLESESFPVDDDKANYIKNLMSSITLPESSIPTWAQYCSEQDWKAKLQEKISCRQTTLFLNEKN